MWQKWFQWQWEVSWGFWGWESPYMLGLKSDTEWIRLRLTYKSIRRGDV